MGKIYSDGTYLKSHPTWHVEDSPWKAMQIESIVKRNGLMPRSICEVGCGAGEILNRLASSFGENVVLHGYEISPQAFELCRSKQKQNLKFFFGDLFTEGDRQFDIVMAIDVIEHVEDYFGFLRNLRRRGRFTILHIPLDLSVQTVLRSRPILRGRSAVGHIHYFTKETALATLRDVGYEVLDYSYTAGSLELPNRGWRANLLKFPRRLAFALHKDLAVRILGGYSLLVLAKSDPTSSRGHTTEAR